MSEDDGILTWAQRRELERELWLLSHLEALTAAREADLADPAVLRAIATRATEVAELADALAHRRGGPAQLERALEDLRARLDGTEPPLG